MALDADQEYYPDDFRCDADSGDKLRYADRSRRR